MPYDGSRFFPRKAIRDVERALHSLDAEPEATDATIGHLVLTNFQDTNIGQVLGLDDRYGAIPLRLPVKSTEFDPMRDLASDSHEYRHEIPYSPNEDQPRLVPVEVDIGLEDPDNADLPDIDAETKPEQLDDIADKIMDYVGFRQELNVVINVRITLPPRRGRPPRKPVVRRVAVELPTITSVAPSFLALSVGGVDTPVQHNPENRCIEWSDIRTRPAGHSDEGEPWHFESPEMVVTIDEPGELFARDELDVEVDIEAPGLLLSGVEARLFDACGRQRRGPGAAALRVRSMIALRCTVVLRDAFARRTLSPYQSFHFDEVIPEDLRVADIATALGDLRFTVRKVNLAGVGGNTEFRHFLFAERTEGPDTMRLWVFVHGDRYTTERRSRRSGGDLYTSTFETGNVRIVVRGTVRGNSRNLIHEVNELQLALRDRFRRLKAQR